MTFRKSLVALAGAVTLALGAHAATASAAPQARLYITPSVEHPGYYNVVVSGQASTGARTVGMRLKGSDEWFDDDLGVSVTGTVVGGQFALYALVWHGTLDEDWGEDEIYASVSDSADWHTNTNEVDGHF